MGVKQCARCGAATSEAQLYLSANGEVCPSCHAQEEQIDRASMDDDPVHYDGGSEGGGWLIWIGLLIGFNVLSALFDWGWWLY